MTREEASDLAGYMLGGAVAATTLYGAWLLWMSWRHKDPCEVPDE